MSELTARFDAVCRRLDDALARSGRAKQSVRLVAVSKLHGADLVAELAAHWALERTDAGPPVFGENYLQEAKEKMSEVAKRLTATAPGLSPHWHFVGHVQSKKAKDIAGNFELIHSVDSLKVAEALQKAWRTRVAPLPANRDQASAGAQGVLVQVNVGRERQKSGVDPDGLEELLRGILEMPELAVRGLMCLPPLAEIGERSRPYFILLRALKEKMERLFGRSFPELSMGMSDDFEAAVEEGATLVRIGTDIFGKRK
jgi:pyridoxal phosphate enzyme (YggS family)